MYHDFLSIPLTGSMLYNLFSLPREGSWNVVIVHDFNVTRVIRFAIITTLNEEKQRRALSWILRDLDSLRAMYYSSFLFLGERYLMWSVINISENIKFLIEIMRNTWIFGWNVFFSHHLFSLGLEFLDWKLILINSNDVSVVRVVNLECNRVFVFVMFNMDNWNV